VYDDTPDGFPLDGRVSVQLRDVEHLQHLNMTPADFFKML
jgi:hypothetical protein